MAVCVVDIINECCTQSEGKKRHLAGNLPRRQRKYSQEEIQPKRGPSKCVFSILIIDK